MKDFSTPHQIVEHFEEGSQSEGLVVMTRGRSRSNKHEGKSSNGWNSRFEDNEWCFECRSQNHWRQNFGIWKVKRNKVKDTESSGEANVLTGDTDDELLTVTDKDRTGDAVKISLSSTSVWILDHGSPFHLCSNMMEFDT